MAEEGKVLEVFRIKERALEKALDSELERLNSEQKKLVKLAIEFGYSVGSHERTCMMEERTEDAREYWKVYCEFIDRVRR